MGTAPALSDGHHDDALETGRKAVVLQAAEQAAARFDYWRNLNNYFHEEDARYLRFLARPGLSVLELGCARGDLLSRLAPASGVGVDFSPAFVAEARRCYPGYEFHCADIEDRALADVLGSKTFDVILMSDTIGSLDDIQSAATRLHAFCTPDTRLIVSYYSSLWEPILRLAEKLGLKMPTPMQNWLSTDDISEILNLADFEEIKRESRQLLPKRLFGIGSFINRVLGPLPGLRRLALRNYLVLRSRRVARPAPASVSIIIPCRNERGNIEQAVRQIPPFAAHQEIIFVEGHSGDGTLDEINRVRDAFPELDIKVAVQGGIGKGDAVRTGFDMASGDILMILDADLTMAPADLPKYFDAIATGKGEFINGSRLVYPIESQAMRFLNLLANRFFAIVFTYLLNQRVTDTLCGTKVISRRHYRDLAAARQYFGEFDPFGDFDLIFGATKLNLKMVEIPIRYRARRYGETQISRFRHGWLLLRMVVFAWWKLKAI